MEENLDKTIEEDTSVTSINDEKEEDLLWEQSPQKYEINLFVSICHW